MSYKTDIENNNQRLENNNINIDNIIQNVQNLPIFNDVNVVNEDVLEGKTFYANGMKRTGTMRNVGQQIIYPSDIVQNISEGYHDGTGYVDVGLNTYDANAEPINIKNGVIAYTNTGKITGTLPVLTYPIDPVTPGNYNYQFIAANNSLKKVTRDNINIMGEYQVATSAQPDSWMFEGNRKMKMGFNESYIANLVKLTPNKLKLGETILGVVGNLESDKPDQSKAVSPSTSQQIITPDTGYELASVTVEAIETETKTVKSTTSSQTVIPTTGKFINEITVSPISLESKDITINQNGTTTITPSQNYDGLSDVDVTVSGILDTSDATATAEDMAFGVTAYVNGNKITGSAATQTGTAQRNVTTQSDIQINVFDKFCMKYSFSSRAELYKRYSAIELQATPSLVAGAIGLTANKLKKDEVVLGITGTYEGIISEQEYNNCLNTANTILGIA